MECVAVLTMTLSYVRMAVIVYNSCNMLKRYFQGLSNELFQSIIAPILKNLYHCYKNGALSCVQPTLI